MKVFRFVQDYGWLTNW